MPSASSKPSVEPELHRKHRHLRLLLRFGTFAPSVGHPTDASYTGCLWRGHGHRSVSRGPVRRCKGGIVKYLVISRLAPCVDKARKTFEVYGKAARMLTGTR